MSKPILQLAELGQSLWYDNIERRLIENGDLERLITQGDIRGLTSNPSIFNNAIGKSNDYDSALVPLAWSGYTARQIFDQLAVEDIQAAADLLRFVYDQTSGGDGFVSLEVSPDLAQDTQGTIQEAHRLWNLVDRPNLMIKIPATAAGIPAIRETIAAGLNINITLIFSISRYLEVMDAYLTGLEKRFAQGEAISTIASVASFFISRIDTKVDDQLDVIIHSEKPEAAIALRLRSQIAIANARLAYVEFQRVFGSERFQRLADHGANIQRPLWASTSTKNPALPDTLYVDELIAPYTVNTVPPKTLSAFKDHGQVAPTIDKNLELARQAMDDLAVVGLSMEQVTAELEDEGVRAFAEAFKLLLETVEARRQAAVDQLGPLQLRVSALIRDLDEAQAAGRLAAGDPTLWTQDSQEMAEIRQRLGWLVLPENSRTMLPDLHALAQDIQASDLTHALLLGMGGSSLAPEVMSLMFGPEVLQTSGLKGLDLAILDSTEPGEILTAAQRSQLEHTLFIVSSKSGTTAEVNALLDYFWEKDQANLGSRAGEHFIAITDPATPLEEFARSRNFRWVFLADPTVGGRYSALTAFGLVPAVLLGYDPQRLLDTAAWMAAQCQPHLPAARNPGLVLGAVLAAGVQSGRDKLTLVSDPMLAPLGSWFEQLIAESSGKDGKGIIPVDGEMPESPDVYGPDRLFVYLRRSGTYTDAVARLRQEGHPVLEFTIGDDAGLGAEFFRWEYATAVACAVLGVNAFNQPDVQDSKNRTRAMLDSFRAQGELQVGEPAWQYKGLKAFVSRALGNSFLESAANLESVFKAFLGEAQTGDYIAIQAFLSRNPGMEVLLGRLQAGLRSRSRLATTLGFGPRYLHSTGQLHKGGPNTGLFLMITAEPHGDIEIPGQEINFSTFIQAQALADFESLQAKNRRVIRLHLPDQQSVHTLITALENL